MLVELDVSELLPIEDEVEELGLDDDVSVEAEPEVVPLAPSVDVELLELGVLVEPLAPMLDVLGVVLELDVLAFAPPWPPAEAAPVPADDEPVPADAPVPVAPLEPEPLDWATATPPMAKAAAAASVVRIFLDMSWTP